MMSELGHQSDLDNLERRESLLMNTVNSAKEGMRVRNS